MCEKKCKNFFLKFFSDIFFKKLFVSQRLPLKDKRLPLYYNVYQPNRCLTRAQDFSILGTGTAKAVLLPLNSNTK